ncbi:MAG: hypothetical protein HYV63_26300 [Candidatus Schekmanbacteria bacterium]|nr:hypothetical protein [Candidatus Schekmanbacteria bacterium]
MTQPGMSMKSEDEALELVRSRLKSWYPGGMDPDDHTPAQWLVRRWAELDREEAARLARACARLLIDPDPELRMGAIHFFASVRDAPDEGALARGLDEHAGLFDGVAAPWPFDGDLRQELGRTLAARARPGDAPLLELLHREALVPGRAGPIIAGLMRADLAWVESHAAEILRLSPRALQPLLYNLQRDSRPVLPLLRSVAGELPPDLFRTAVSAVFPDGPLRREALALVPAAG